MRVIVRVSLPSQGTIMTWRRRTLKLSAAVPAFAIALLAARTDFTLPMTSLTQADISAPSQGHMMSELDMPAVAASDSWPESSIAASNEQLDVPKVARQISRSLADKASAVGEEFDVVIMQSSLVDVPELLSGGPVYTVYMQVGDTVEWTMHYSVLNTAAVQSGRVIQIANGRAVAPPYPRTAFVPAAFAPPAAGSTFISGVLTEDGTLQELQVVGLAELESESLLAIMRQWQFRPARSGNDVLTLQVLIAIPGTNARAIQ